MIVVDASALVPALLAEAGSKGLIDRLLADDSDLHAPHLIDIEVVSVLRKVTIQGAVDRRRAELALRNLHDLHLTRHAHALQLPRLWALRSNLSPYDAAYVALAEFLDAPLVTRDRRLAAAPGHAARIEVL